MTNDSISREEATRRTRRSFTRGVWALPLLASPLLAGGGSQPEELWAHQHMNEAYWDYAVTLANNGTTTFTDSGFIDTVSRLYSTSRGSSATPVWQRTLSGNSSFNRSLASADNADVHAVVRHQGSELMDRHARLEIYRSSSSQPVFSHTFSEQDPGTGSNWCHVTDGGESVIACYISGSSVHVKRFDALPGSGSSFVQNGDWVLPTFGQATSVGMTNDLRSIYLGSMATGKVFDLLPGSAVEVFYTWYIGGASSLGHAFSEDGLTLAVPAQERIDIYKRQGAGFSLTSSLAAYPSGGPHSAHLAALSSNGRIVATAYRRSPDLLEASVVAWNVDSGAQLLFDSLSGQDQNTPQDLVMSDSGKRIAVAFSGVQEGVVPGIRVYERQAETAPYETYVSFDRPGPVFDIDIAADGSRLAAASRATTPSQGWGHKITEAIDLGKDLDLFGVPHTGAQVVFEYRPWNPVPGAPCYLVSNDSLEPVPLGYPFGSLYVERTGANLIPIGSVGSDGMASYPMTLSGAVGTTRYYQGFSSPPRQLSQTWLPVTILP